MGLVVAIALAMTERSSATVNTIIYNFSGTCQDCSGTATATLTVVGNYTLGTALSSSNVVSFTYNGTNIIGPFTMTPSSPNFFVSGSITNYPGTNNVNIQTTQSNSSNFFSSTNGSWAVGNLSDFGSVSIWGTSVPTTPAPSAGILLALGLVTLAGFNLWRRRQHA
jgi:MYXO-CTERM domain-containing protein